MGSWCSLFREQAPPTLLKRPCFFMCWNHMVDSQTCVNVCDDCTCVWSVFSWAQIKANSVQRVLEHSSCTIGGEREREREEHTCHVSLIITDNILFFAIIRDISVTYIWGAAASHKLFWILHAAGHQQRRGQRVENKQVNTLRYKCFFNSNFYFWAYTIII